MKNKAQSIIELISVIMLVTLGIYLIGPTVIRGINAHFKIWDESVQDSYNDRLVKAPADPNFPANCVCDSTWTGGPGQRCGAGPCEDNERYENILCNPKDCGKAQGLVIERCIPDNTCCTTEVDTPNCGRGPLPPVAGDCTRGWRITQKGCGSKIVYGCRFDNKDTAVDGNPSCIPHCLGAYAIDETVNPDKTVPIICPGPPRDDTVVATGAPDGLNSLGPTPPDYILDTTGVGKPLILRGTLKSSCAHLPKNDPDNKCEAYCVADYRPVGSHCEMECPLYVTGVSFSNICPNDKGALSLNYETGVLSANGGDIHGTVTINYSNNPSKTIQYDCFNKNCVLSTQLPGIWSTVRDMNITASGYGRNGGGPDNNPTAKTTGFHWDDTGPSGCANYSVSVNNLSIVELCNWCGAPAPDGLKATLSDKCIDDNGGTAFDDSLQIYCLNNIARFCLSNEECPWRTNINNPAGTNKTCENLNLFQPKSYDLLANIRDLGNTGCIWNNRIHYNCDPTTKQAFFNELRYTTSATDTTYTISGNPNRPNCNKTYVVTGVASNVTAQTALQNYADLCCGSSPNTHDRVNYFYVSPTMGAVGTFNCSAP